MTAPTGHLRKRLKPPPPRHVAARLIGSRADMLRPLAIKFIGAVCISMLLSLVASPTAYFLMLELCEARVFKLLRPRD